MVVFNYAIMGMRQGADSVVPYPGNTLLDGNRPIIPQQSQRPARSAADREAELTRLWHNRETGECVDTTTGDVIGIISDL